MTAVPAGGWARAPWAAAAATALALGVFFWPGSAEYLGFERSAILRGAWWRLGTGHWVHFGASHLVWNLAVLIPAGVWAERLSPLRLRLLLALAPWVIGGALLVLVPALEIYGGLSGVAAAVLAFLAFTQLAGQREDRWFWRAVLVLLAVKIGLELLAEGPLFARFASPDLHAVPLAHLAGVVCAALGCFVGRRRR